MTSWKRLFGKITKKGHKKVEQNYELRLKRLQQEHGVTTMECFLKENINKKKKNH